MTEEEKNMSIEEINDLIEDLSEEWQDLQGVERDRARVKLLALRERADQLEAEEEE